MDLPAGSEAGRSTQEKVEQLLRDAHIQRVRGQWSNAERLCRKALEVDPDDSMGREMLGDILAARGEHDPALEAYRQAFERQPEKAALEEKIARLVLLKGEEERERREAQMLLESPLRKVDQKRNATLATLLCIPLPGLGQLLVYRQWVKGGILAGVGLVSILGIGELLKLLLLLGGVGSRVERPNDLLAGLGVLGVLVWVYSLLDAAAGGKGKKASDV